MRYVYKYKKLKRFEADHINVAITRGDKLVNQI